MLFGEKPKEEVKPKKGNLLAYLASAFLSLFGGFYVYTEMSTPKPVQVVSASKLEIDMDSALNGKTKEEKEKIYKVFQGLADYSKNVERAKKNKQVRDMLEEVYIAYGIDGGPSQSIKPFVDEVFTNTGLKADDDFAVVRSKVGDSCQELANAVKYSIERDLSKKD